jgi:hypothetical protein
VFSDEAHHTYGQALDAELKKVRKTVDYLAANTNVICVVNTTGTPYFRRQPLKDVVIWYGLSEGIRDGVLKDLAGNIQAYDFSGDAGAYVAHIVEDFFQDYGGVQLPNGAPAKLAIYFPQTDDVKALRPVIDQAMATIGLSPTICLVNTSDDSLTKQADIDAFNRLNDPAAPHRVILLVNKGTEGWNCPSLFACALARRLRTSNNFVLQAATRCLRQVPGNNAKARVYLSRDNFSILDRQLQETYGETIRDLNQAAQKSRRAQIVLRKLAIPPLLTKRLVRTVVRSDTSVLPLRLDQVETIAAGGVRKATFTLGIQQATRSVLRQVGEAVTIEAEPVTVDIYAIAVELAAQYRLDVWTIYDELERLYPGREVPLNQIDGLAEQVEVHLRSYTVHEETVEVALALIRPAGFRKEAASGTEVYTADIMYPVDREHLLLRPDEVKENRAGYGFHYVPYNFDSNPEKSFYEHLLQLLAVDPDDVEDVYFTGAVTDPSKTEFFIEYKDDKGKWHRYSPDFVVRKKPEAGGKVLIVEIKRESERDDPVQGVNGLKAMKLREWVGLNPEQLKYEMVFTPGTVVTSDQMKPVRQFVEGEPA